MWSYTVCPSYNTTLKLDQRHWQHVTFEKITSQSCPKAGRGWAYFETPHYSPWHKYMPHHPLAPISHVPLWGLVVSGERCNDFSSGCPLRAGTSRSSCRQTRDGVSGSGPYRSYNHTMVNKCWCDFHSYSDKIFNPSRRGTPEGWNGERRSCPPRTGRAPEIRCSRNGKWGTEGSERNLAADRLLLVAFSAVAPELEAFRDLLWA